MSREVAFYLMSTGLGIYGTLFLLLVLVPFLDAFSSQLSIETLVFYLFLTVIFTPISLALVSLSRQRLQLFQFDFFYGVYFLPLILIWAIIFFVF